MPNQQGDVKFKFGSLDEYNRLTNIDENTWYIITDTGNERIYIGSQLFVDRSTSLIWESGTEPYTAVQTTAPTDKGTANAVGAVSIGLKNQAQGEYSLAQGWNTSTESLGKYSHSEGYKTKAIGQSAHSEGSGTEAHGNYSHSEGGNTKSIGLYSHASGLRTVAYNNYMTSAGKYNKYDEADSSNNDSHTLFVVGVGTALDKRSDGLKVNSDGSASSLNMGGSVAVNKFSCNNETVTGNSSVGGNLSVTGSVAAGNITGSSITGDSITLNNSGTPYFSVDTTNGIKLGVSTTSPDFRCSPGGTISAASITAGAIVGDSIKLSNIVFIAMYMGEILNTYADIYLGDDVPSGYLLTQASPNNPYYSSYVIPRSQLKLLRVDSTAADVYIYGDGIDIGTLQDGTVKDLTTSTYGLIEISTTQLYTNNQSNN